MRSPLRYILVLSCFVLLHGVDAAAQFKEDAFSQTYNDDQASPADSVDKMFSLKEYFGGLGHKNDLKIGTMFAGSTVFVGGCQIYNRDYWKLPIVYGGIAAGVTGGILAGKNGKEDLSSWLYAGAGLVWWGSLMDGVINYTPADYPNAGKATLYAILVPGLGQAYNNEYWKIPIYLGGMVGSAHFYFLNRTNYKRFRRIYREATSTTVPYTGPISSDTALYYRDVYRRYRDYSVLAFAAFYLLQVIDANVFSYMHEFNVSDDIAMSVSPAAVGSDASFAFAPAQGVGLRLGIRF